MDEALGRAIELEPGMFAAYNHLGLALHDREISGIDRCVFEGDFADAELCEERITNLSQAYLVLGDYPACGWAEYEWRLGVPSIVATRKFDRPRWDGSNPAGKTIFVHRGDLGT